MSILLTFLVGLVLIYTPYFLIRYIIKNFTINKDPSMQFDVDKRASINGSKTDLFVTPKPNTEGCRAVGGAGMGAAAKVKVPRMGAALARAAEGRRATRWGRVEVHTRAADGAPPRQTCGKTGTCV